MNRDKIAQLLKEQSMFVQEATPRITTKIVPCYIKTGNDTRVTILDERNVSTWMTEAF